MVYGARKVQMVKVDIESLKEHSINDLVNNVQDYEEIDYNLGSMAIGLGGILETDSGERVILETDSSGPYSESGIDEGESVVAYGESVISGPLIDNFNNEVALDSNRILMSDGSWLELIDKDKYAVGIDVSTYQGDIDWEKAKEKIDFAILRVGITTENGNMYVDDKFLRNIEECNRLGIPVGVYYYSNALDKDTNDKEIDLVLSTLKGCNIQLPVYRDLEGTCQTDLLSGSIGQTRQEQLTLDFCEAMDNAGFVGGLYIHNRYSDLVPNVSENHPVWCCGSLYYNSTSNDYSLNFDNMVYGYNYDDNGDMKPELLEGNINMYQPSCEGIGSSLGINTGFVDLDYMDGDYFNNLLNSIYISDSN